MLALAVDNAMSLCNTRQTQVNLTMCNWQGLRGAFFFFFSKIATIALPTDRNSERSTRHGLPGWRLPMATAVRKRPIILNLQLIIIEGTMTVVQITSTMVSMAF